MPERSRIDELLWDREQLRRLYRELNGFDESELLRLARSWQWNESLRSRDK